MKMQRRISQLEKRFHIIVNKEFDVDLSFRVAGKARSWAQQKAIERFRKAMVDPRATEEQREKWSQCITSIEQALKSQLERDRGRCCSKCGSLNFAAANDTAHRCTTCGKLFRRKEDGTYIALQ